MSLRDRLQKSRAKPSPAPLSEAQAAKALAGRRGRASIAAAPKAGKAAAALLRPLIPQGAMGLSELKRRWSEIAGPPFADKAAPDKFVGGVLSLRAPGALAPFLQQQAPLLIERLRLAGAQVKSIRIDQRAAPAPSRANVRPLKRAITPAEETALAQALDRVSDAGLRSALMRLGRAVRRD
jgi:hypothetical protein